jgi:hypothetical protein
VIPGANGVRSIKSPGVKMLAELPATIDDLMRQLESPGGEPDIEDQAEALAAIHA